MQYLTLQINGTPIQAPTEIQRVTNKAGILGEDALRYGVLLFLMVIVTAALFFLLWGGLAWITSEGDKQKLAAARSRITYAIVGLVVSFLSFLIINIISTLFNIKLLG